MSTNATYQGGGLGFFSVLFLVFLVLKLIGQITWSWWWVTAPLWMPAAAFLGFVFIFFGFIMVAALLGTIVKVLLSRKS
jgi:hypothetical protein